MIRAPQLFLVACLLTFYISGFGQKNPQNILTGGNFEPIWTFQAPKFQVAPEQAKSNFWIAAIYKPLKGDHYAGNTGFVCKKEWAFEKSTGLPLKIRLGSIDYTNWLEQKNGRRY